MSGAPIAQGSRVTLHFTLSLADGTQVDTTAGEEPHTFTLGDSTLHPNLERLLIGLTAGERRSWEVEAEEGFGLPDLDNVHTVALETFAGGPPAEPGVVIGFTTPEGEEMPGTVLAVEGEQVSVDFNHPLAGHDLVFEVEIVSVE